MINLHREPRTKSRKRICGCRANCKGLQKLVSLSTFNRHRKHRHEESFSAEFRGFLASSSAQIDQREATFNNIPESKAETSVRLDTSPSQRLELLTCETERAHDEYDDLSKGSGTRWNRRDSRK